MTTAQYEYLAQFRNTDYFKGCRILPDGIMELVTLHGLAGYVDRIDKDGKCLTTDEEGAQAYLNQPTAQKHNSF